MTSLTLPGAIRPRRLRRTPALRTMVAETCVQPACLMQPFFVVAGPDDELPIQAMPGISRLGVNRLIAQIERAMEHGLRQVMLFGVLEEADKDSSGACASDPKGPVTQAVRALKKRFGAELVVATDVCLCGALSHGHCGVLTQGTVDNDASLAPLAEMACAHADAGADIVAPSDMMDGRVLALRQALDLRGHSDVALMSYSVKYASAYYGPFRQAASSAPAAGDRKSYQMDPANVREALKEAELDVAEGADMLMVKPALAYLDVIAKVKAHTLLPLACYNVSGEYALVKAGAQAGLVDEPSLVRENLLAMRRAGADILITYHAIDALAGGWLSR